MKKNNLIRMLSATLSLLILVCCIGANFSPAKYKGTFDGVDIALTVNAADPEEPAVITVLEAGPTFNARIKTAKTITFGKPADYPQFTWSLTEPTCLAKVDADGTGGIQLFDDGAGNYYVLCEDTIATGTDCSKMFYGCSDITTINGLETLDTSNAKTMAAMFQQCKGLVSLNLSNFDTSNVTDMNHMFYGMSVDSLDVSNFDTSNVSTMTSMFAHCEKIETLNLSNFNTEKVTSMGSMFYICKALKSVNLSSFNTEKVTTMAHMFYACHSISEIDISSFSTPVLKDIQAMFSDCDELTTIYASKQWTNANVTNADTVEVFIDSTKLVGGGGTIYDVSNVNKTYARLDLHNGGGPGYFTYKALKYTIYYHTFDSSGNDYIWKTAYAYEDEEITLSEAHPDHAELAFLGWSPHGTWVSDDQSSFYPSTYDGQLSNMNHEDYVPEKRILASGGTNVMPQDILVDEESTDIHLYDLFSEYNIVLDATNTGEYFVSGHISIFETDYVHDSTIARDNVRLYAMFDRWYWWVDVLPGEGNYVPHYGIYGKTRTHYVHPGLQYSYGRGSTVVPNDEQTATKEIKYNTTATKNGNDITDQFYIFGLEQFTIKLTVKKTVTTISGGGNSGGCFATGTLITMADGSRLPIEDVQQGDVVRVYDHENGCYTESSVLFTEYEGDAEWNVVNLEFSDGTTQEFIFDHALFDLDLNEYVYITAENYHEFIGHRFVKEKDSGYETVTLEKAWAEVEYTGCYSMTTQYHLNYFVNGMFSMPGGISGLFNFFEYDEDLKYDPDLMERDIERYGLFTYDDFADYMPEAVFEQIFPIKYLKVSIGKGLTTFEDLEAIIERYIYGHDLLDNFEEFPEEELEETEDLEENTEENGETETKDESTDEEKATLNFEVENLTFDFADNEIVTNEDAVITFTVGDGYELPETIVITIDGEEYIIYTSEEDSDKNPEGITFDIETGTVTISKDLLKDAEAITIAAEGVKKEDEESENKEEIPDADKKDESEDKENTDKENESEGSETTDKETESGTDTPNTEDKTETEGGTDDLGEGNATKPEDGTDAPDGENTETTTPETNPDNTTEGEENGGDNGEDNGETETPGTDTEVTTPTTPDTEDNTNTEQGGEDAETSGNGEGSTENGTDETTPDTESGDDDEATTPTEPTTPAEPSEPVVTPDTPSTSKPTTGGNDDNGETGSADGGSAEGGSNSGNDSTQSNVSSESTTSTTPSVTPTAPTTSSPAASKTSALSASTPTSGNTSTTPASSAPAPSTNSNSNGVSQASGTTTSSGNEETSSEE